MKNLAKILTKLKNEIFVVTFIKRTTGEIRTMKCRKGVKKHLVGSGSAYDAKDYNLLVVWDIDIYNKLVADGATNEEAGPKSYRSIPLEMILKVSVNGKTHEIREPVLKTYRAVWTNGNVEIKGLTEEHAIANLKNEGMFKSKPRNLELTVIHEQSYKVS